MTRLLASKPLVGIGLISYSIYLWQQPFLNRHFPALPTSFPLNLALVFIAASISYYAIERPFLDLRQRLRLG